MIAYSNSEYVPVALVWFGVLLLGSSIPYPFVQVKVEEPVKMLTVVLAKFEYWEELVISKGAEVVVVGTAVNDSSPQVVPVLSAYSSLYW